MQQIAIPDWVEEATACKIIGGEHTPIHRSTLWRGIKAGRYSAPTKVAPRTNRWSASALIAEVERPAIEHGKSGRGADAQD